MSSRIAPVLLGALLLGACAGGVQAPTVTPDRIPALEATVAAEPGNGEALTLLGVAYYNAARMDDAVAVLRRAAALPDAAPVAQLYLGLAHEANEEWQDASRAYAAYLAGADDSSVRDDVERRIALVERELMQQQLRTMLAQEAALSSQPAQARTVAVFPFRVVSEDPRYEPLQFALADMVTTDLGIPGSLQLLERSQIQALVQEMALTLAGFTDASSGARVGRLMRAEHVVQGSVVVLDDERLRMEMAVVDPAQAQRRGEAADETQLASIFDAEKQLVLELFSVLGITLTPAEREAIEENRTGNLLALLAYGEGLEAMDRGDYGAATAAFRNAAQIDPGFQAAQVRATESADLQDAAETSGSEIAAAAESELTGAPDAAVSSVADLVIADINPSGADQIAQQTPGSEITRESTSQDSNSGAGGAAGGTRVPIVIDNPNVE